MSLRWKLVLFFSVVFALFMLMAQAVMHSAVMPGFDRLEQQEAIRDVQRCTDATRQEIHSLSIFLLTWSAWDDAYQFMSDHNAEFIKSNCPPETYTNNTLNLIWICDPTGKLIWGETRDARTGQLIDIKDFTPAMLSAKHPLINFATAHDMTGGFVLTDHGPMLIVARPIVTSHNEGPIRGSLIMGRLFLADQLGELVDQTHVNLKLWPARQDQIPPSDRNQLAAARPGREQIVRASDHMLYAYSMIDDIYGRPALLIRADIPRDITASGLEAAHAALWLNLIGAAAIVLAGLWMMQIVIVRPLSKMSRHMLAMAARDDLKSRLNLRRGDEIGLLADQFDRLVASLAESRSKTVEAAHRTGMLDIATDVLHNVGNAINTVNVSAAVLDERLRGSKVSSLAQAAEMLKAHRADLSAFLTTDPRGSKIIEYLADLAAVMRSDQEQSQTDLQRLREKVHHIREIISTQLEHASTATFTETEEFASVLDAVLQMNAEAIQSRKIALTQDIDEASTIPMNKAKFMQVMNNLVQNAIEAAPSEGGCLVVRTWRTEDSVRIEVADNGAGIDPKTRTKLFRHGFTTKPTGHGFGLHYCANAVREAGGKIRVESDGLGRGAKFIVELPLVGVLDLSAEESDERQVA